MTTYKWDHNQLYDIPPRYPSKKKKEKKKQQQTTMSHFLTSVSSWKRCANCRASSKRFLSRILCRRVSGLVSVRQRSRTVDTLPASLNNPTQPQYVLHWFFHHWHRLCNGGQKTLIPLSYLQELDTDCHVIMAHPQYIITAKSYRQ